MEDEDGDTQDSKDVKIPHGHITSISVMRDYRKLGIATKLMRAAQNAMQNVYGAQYVSLHVRVTNRAAITLYRDVLKYEISSVEEQYYADKEDAYDMNLFFTAEAKRAMKKKIAKKKSPVEEEKKEASSGAGNTISTQTEDFTKDSAAAGD